MSIFYPKILFLGCFRAFFEFLDIAFKAYTNFHAKQQFNQGYKRKFAGPLDINLQTLNNTVHEETMKFP